MASIFKFIGLVSFGMCVFCSAGTAQIIFQNDTPGNTFYDGSAIVGAGIPQNDSVSDFISYEVSMRVSQRASTIIDDIKTNKFTPNAATDAQQLILALVTDPGFDTASALTQRLKEVGISTELARLLSDRLDRLFVSDLPKKWQIDTKLKVNVEQLTKAVETLNKVIDLADPKSLAKPPDELIVIQKVLAQLVIASNQ